MRVVAGELRGRRIDAPLGSDTRPTTDKVREAVFNALGSLDLVRDASVADLFAGTGALGLEALSRGAAHCTFVEKDRAALDALRRNVEKLGAGARSEIRAQAVEYAPLPARPCEIVFIDPPYGAGLAEPALLRGAQWLAPGGWLSLEVHGEAPAPPAGVALEAERRFGKATLLLMRRT